MDSSLKSVSANLPLSSHSKDSIFICTGIDDYYLWPWMVSIFSASIHSQKKIKVGLGVISGNFSLENLRVVQNFCKYLDIDLVYREFVFDFSSIHNKI